MILIDGWEQDKRDVAKIQRMIDEAKGRYKEVMKRLKQKYGVKDLSHAKRMVEVKGKKERLAAKVWAKAHKAFKPKKEKLLKLMEELT